MENYEYKVEIRKLGAPALLFTLLPWASHLALLGLDFLIYTTLLDWMFSSILYFQLRYEDQKLMTVKT